MGVFPVFFDIDTACEMISFWLSMLQYLARNSATSSFLLF
ncbi:hypothetical protein HMPREF9382_2115 [Streptococcus sanguinis SK115]|uniref:Uncharacterized protein n=1 Tax=Streptococcus sanguinis SK115 TaxID=888810 RepID=F0IBH7_STRSA|nr:hypothetical protein HMPREF9382_2115 [Streptococcus sanguinis SK115]